MLKITEDKIKKILPLKGPTFNEVKKQIVERIRKLSLSNLEKEIRKNQNITIVDFEDVSKKVNN